MTEVCRAYVAVSHRPGIRRRPSSDERAAMIVIDTNVVSELIRLTPEPAVMRWFSGQDSGELYLTAVSDAELRAGAAILPAGQRRDRLAAGIDAIIRQDFADCGIAVIDPWAGDRTAP